jgi:hypothetical protein
VYEPDKHVLNVGGCTVIACGRGGFKRCSVPGCTRRGERLCDYPVTRAGVQETCDVRLCLGHAASQGPDRDYCPAHAKLAGRVAP